MKTLHHLYIVAAAVAALTTAAPAPGAMKPQGASKTPKTQPVPPEPEPAQAPDTVRTWVGDFTCPDEVSARELVRDVRDAFSHRPTLSDPQDMGTVTGIVTAASLLAITVLLLLILLALVLKNCGRRTLTVSRGSVNAAVTAPAAPRKSDIRGMLDRGANIVVYGDTDRLTRTAGFLFRTMGEETCIRKRRLLYFNPESTYQSTRLTLFSGKTVACYRDALIASRALFGTIPGVADHVLAAEVIHDLSKAGGGVCNVMGLAAAFGCSRSPGDLLKFFGDFSESGRDSLRTAPYELMIDGGDGWKFADAVTSTASALSLFTDEETACLFSGEAPYGEGTVILVNTENIHLYVTLKPLIELSLSGLASVGGIPFVSAEGTTLDEELESFIPDGREDGALAEVTAANMRENAACDKERGSVTEKVRGLFRASRRDACTEPWRGPEAQARP